jgi:hypothetical protein
MPATLTNYSGQSLGKSKLENVTFCNDESDTLEGDGRMSKLRKREQAAIEAVARHFSATWEIGKEDSPDAYVTIAGKQIAVEVTAIKRTTGAKGCGFEPRRMQVSRGRSV